MTAESHHEPNPSPTASVPSDAVAGSTRPRARTRLGGKLLLLLAAAVVGLLALEGLVRVAGLDKPLIYEPDSELGWRHIPHSHLRFTEEGDGIVEINSLGNRDRERQLEKPAGTFRIAVLGDSMTEGNQVNQDQTFTALLESKLSRQDRPVEVLNFGVAGYGTVQELAQFEADAVRYRPDVVVVAVFLDNDVADCHPRLTTRTNGAVFASADRSQFQFDRSQAEASHGDYHREPIHTLRRYSATYRLISGVRNRRLNQAAAAAPSQEVPRRFGLYLASPAPEWEEAWDTLERTLVEFAVRTRRRGMSLMVVSVPAGQVVNAAAWESLLSNSPLMRVAHWDLDGPERRLRAIADTHGIPLLQPAAAFRAASGSDPLFFGNVGHFTARGHALMADRLQAFMREQGLVSTPPIAPN